MTKAPMPWMGVRVSPSGERGFVWRWHQKDLYVLLDDNNRKRKTKQQRTPQKQRTLLPASREFVLARLFWYLPYKTCSKRKSVSLADAASNRRRSYTHSLFLCLVRTVSGPTPRSETRAAINLYTNKKSLARSESSVGKLPAVCECLHISRTNRIDFVSLRYYLQQK